jgi:polyferredoxin
VARVPIRRPLWLTVPLYAVLLVVVVLDLRAAVFWARVGGSLGTLVALAAGGIALLAVLLLVVDLRRQVLLGADRRDDDRSG